MLWILNWILNTHPVLLPYLEIWNHSNNVINTVHNMTRYPVSHPADVPRSPDHTRYLHQMQYEILEQHDDWGRSRIFGQGVQIFWGGIDLTILPIFSKNSPWNNLDSMGDRRRGGGGVGALTEPLELPLNLPLHETGTELQTWNFYPACGEWTCYHYSNNMFILRRLDKNFSWYFEMLLLFPEHRSTISCKLSPEVLTNRCWHVLQTVSSWGENLHELSNPIF